MKMRKALLYILALTLIIAFALSGCSYPALTFEGTPDLSYAVVSNGGSVVQVGEYVYFINGIATEDDTDTDSNAWGNVVKGALYRAKLVNGEAKTITKDIDPYKGYYGDYKTYAATENSITETYSGFEMAEPMLDYTEEEEIYTVGVTRIIPKKITNGGYDKGGIFVFGNWIYYSSPNSQKDRQGALLNTQTDFFRTKHDGSGTQKLYTTENTKDSIKYGYYYYNDCTYLVVLDGTNLISIAANDNKVSGAKTIVEDVTGVEFGTKPVWTKNTSDDQTEDFVYFTRAVTKDDADPNGNVLERIRPDGAENTRIILSNTGSTVTLISINQGFVYYSEQTATGTILCANSFLSFPMWMVDKNTIGETGVKVDESNTLPPASQTGRVVVHSNYTGITNTYPSNQIVSYNNTTKVLSATHYMVGVKSSSTICVVAPSTVETVILSGITAKVMAVTGSEFTFISAGEDASQGKLMKANLFDRGQSAFELTADVINVASFFPAETVAGYHFYVYSLVKVYERENTETETYVTANNYSRIRRDTRIAEEREFDMRELAEEDIPEEEEEEEEAETTDSCSSNLLSGGVLPLSAAGLTLVVVLFVKRRKEA